MNYYTCETVNNIHQDVLDVCYAYTASSKNIYNSALYLIRQLATSYDKVIKENNEISYVVKDNLHKNNLEILNLAHQTIELINSKRLDNLNKLKSQLDFDKPIKEILVKLKNQYDKLSPNYEPEISDKIYYKFLDPIFLNNLLKLKEQKSVYKDYTEVSNHIAQTAVKRAVDDYKNYLASLKAYFKNKVNFLGFPKLPSYKSKTSRLTYELDKNRLTKEGYLSRIITKDNINTFGSIKDKTNTNKLFTCPQKNQVISSKSINYYNQFSFTEIINQTVKQVQQSDNEQLNQYNHQNKSKVEFISFKFIPNDKHLVNGKPKVIVQTVLKHTVDLPDNHLLSQILKINAKFLELNDLDKIKFIQEHFKNDNNKIASMDFGVVNHIAMTFNNKSKAIVISGKKYNNYVRNKNLELDDLKSKIIPQAIKDIQVNYAKLKTDYEKINSKPDDYEIRIVKDNNSKQDIKLTCLKESKRLKLITKEDYPRLNKSDKLLLSQSSLTIYSHPDYCKQLTSLNNYKNSYLHKLSSSIIDLCNFNKIQYLVIGKNDLWKQASDMSKTNNKDFHSIAHTELIDYIKYKALLFGIVVLVTEESYTSKTSFVNGAKLLKFNDKLVEDFSKNTEARKKDKLKKFKAKESQGVKPTKIKFSVKANHKIRKEDKSLKSKFGGYRLDRGVYVNESKNKFKQGKMPHNLVVHADVNASYNIMCKVFKQIKYNPLYHELSYKIMAVKSNKFRLQLLV